MEVEHGVFFCFFKGMYYWRAKYFFTSMIMGGRVKQSVAVSFGWFFLMDFSPWQGDLESAYGRIAASFAHMVWTGWDP